MKVLLAHPGTQHSFRLAQQLERQNCLGRFLTGLAFVPGDLLEFFFQCLGSKYERAAANRRLEGVPVAKLKTQLLVELAALLKLRSGQDFQGTFLRRNLVFQRNVSERDLVDCDIVIGFNTSSWILADRAMKLGRPFVLDQTIGHPLSYQKVCQTLRREFPDWSDGLPPSLPEMLAAEKAEHESARQIIAASSFTRRTLIENGVAEDKIVINPYGVDVAAFSPVPRPNPSRPLRFLFLGSLIPRKGVPLLLKVWNSISPQEAELWMVGNIHESLRPLITPARGLRLMGRIPHRELPGLLQQCDILVFPSYFEGYGLVLLEAMAAGLPIIATDATGAPDLITSGVEGFVVGAGNEEELLASMRKFIDSPGDLHCMSQAARRCAERYSWDAYGDRWFEILQRIAKGS
jgi:alpha-maltose-1-phosphate synthase